VEARRLAGVGSLRASGCAGEASVGGIGGKRRCKRRAWNTQRKNGWAE
jgi:hypothetical protein